MLKLKKVLAMACLLACLFNIQMPMAMAAEKADDADFGAVPYMTYITDASCELTIEDGYACVYAYVTGRSSAVTECEIVIELQEKSLLTWETVHTWDKTVSDYKAVSDVMKKITAGNSYRAVVTVTVWSGSNSESQTLTSETVKA